MKSGGCSTKLVPFPVILLLGFSPAIGIVFGPLVALHAIFQHANVRWHFGPLRWVVASPAWHRWHHAVEPEAIDKNYAGLFPFYDRIFKTAYFPKRAPTVFGLVNRAGFSNEVVGSTALSLANQIPTEQLSLRPPVFGEFAVPSAGVHGRKAVTGESIALGCRKKSEPVDRECGVSRDAELADVQASQGSLCPGDASLREWTRDCNRFGETRFAQQFVNFLELFPMKHQ